MDFKPVSVHFHSRSHRFYSKNRQGKKRFYSDDEARDLMKTGGSVFNLQHHWQRFKNFFSLAKNVAFGHGSGRKIKDKHAMSKNRQIGAQLADAAYNKKVPQGFSVYRRHKKGYYTIYKKDTPLGKPERYTISYRGTKLSSGSDLYQDLKIAMGKNAPRAKELTPEIQQFLKNHDKAIVSMTGHSLGSHLALEHFSKFKNKHKNVKNAYLYALPGTPFRVGRHRSDMQKQLRDGRVEVSIKNGDPVSMGLGNYSPKNMVTLKNDSGKLVSIGNHGTDNFSDWNLDDILENHLKK